MFERRPSSLGGLIRLAALVALVEPGISAAQCLAGTYVGNGVDNRAITGLGFRPEVVIIRGSTTGVGAVLRSAAMVGDASKIIAIGQALVTDHIQSLDADGFTSGTSADVNGAGGDVSLDRLPAGAGRADHILVPRRRHG
jgi:hypothetical protein